jgi:hypothetical protein
MRCVLLAAAAAVLASGCGSQSNDAVAGKLATNLGTALGHPVSTASCTNGVANPPAGAPAPDRNDRTCSVTFSDGTPKQVWAVRVSDYGITLVQPLYRLDKPTGPAGPEIVKTVRTNLEMVSGKPVRFVRCAARSGLEGGASQLCVAVFADGTRARWAVKTLPFVQLVYQPL